MRVSSSSAIPSATIWLLLLLLALALCGGPAACHGGGGGGTGCARPFPAACHGGGGGGTGCARPFPAALVQLLPCRAAVARFSSTPPSPTCCDAVRSLGQPCLCALINGPPMIGVDRIMALQLPRRCNVQFEPCNAGD